MLPTFHSLSMGIGFRASISNYMYNHIGHFAASGEALCKALFMGGVTRRFPTLKFAFLEGGVGWAAGLYADLIGHWEKRNAERVQRYNPARVDRELFLDLCQRYGGKLVEDRLSTKPMLLPVADQGADLVGRDDWSRCGITSARDIRDLFIPHFYFGCEADDPMNANAFDTRRNPFGARLNAIFSSDIGHWDVPDMREVTHEAYEMVEKGLIGEDDFRRFVFENPGRMWLRDEPRLLQGHKGGASGPRIALAGCGKTGAETDWLPDGSSTLHKSWLPSSIFSPWPGGDKREGAGCGDFFRSLLALKRNNNRAVFREISVALGETSVADRGV